MIEGVGENLGTLYHFFFDFLLQLRPANVANHAQFHARVFLG